MMIPYEAHKIIFTIGNRFAIFTWGFVMAIAWLFSGFFVYKEAKKNRGINLNMAMQFLLMILLGTLLGARLLHFFGPWGYGTFYERLKAMFSPRGGWVGFGGMIGGIIFPLVYCKIKKIKFLRYVDIVAPAMSLGIFIVKIGCFLSGCCFGTGTNVPWAIIREGIAIHPVQLYDALINLAIFVLMLELYRRHNLRKRYYGYLLFSAVTLYSVGRFFTEFFRGDHDSGMYYFGLTASQIIALLMILVFGAAMIMKREKIKARIPKPCKKTRFSYILVSGGGALSIISALFININLYLLLAPLILGGLILFYGLVVYTGSEVKNQKS